ncbi:MAG: hypothetical protein LE180_03855 [Endomicrobium sp.]|uniref:hypothetical protein n=1 Tax=Candidatus Endomicrobiellum pyrsonymphae TaxID=1408203 RepID=UPI0035886CD7|nr:hypothetical protein [Endomicrobium sp.]
MKDFKKAVSVVVLFSFVFSACDRNANLVRGNLVGADVGTPSAITGEDNSQKGYKDELGSFTKPKSVDGQLSMFDTSQGIPVTDTTKPKSADGQLQMLDTSQGIHATDTTKPITFNNPSGVALNPHTFPFQEASSVCAGKHTTTIHRHIFSLNGNYESWDSIIRTSCPPAPSWHNREFEDYGYWDDYYHHPYLSTTRPELA